MGHASSLEGVGRSSKDRAGEGELHTPSRSGSHKGREEVGSRTDPVRRRGGLGGTHRKAVDGTIDCRSDGIANLQRSLLLLLLSTRRGPCSGVRRGRTHVGTRTSVGDSWGRTKRRRGRVGDSGGLGLEEANVTPTRGGPGRDRGHASAAETSEKKLREASTASPSESSH